MPCVRPRPNRRRHQRARSSIGSRRRSRGIGPSSHDAAAQVVRFVGPRGYRRGMRASGTFEVTAFEPTSVPSPGSPRRCRSAWPRSRSGTRARWTGRSATLFTSAFDQATGVGTYVAMESFEGSLNGRAGAFNFVHSATTSGADRAGEYFAIVPSSGTGELAGITGTGSMTVDADGTHRIAFDSSSVLVVALPQYGDTVSWMRAAYD